MRKTSLCILGRVSAPNPRWSPLMTAHFQLTSMHLESALWKEVCLLCWVPRSLHSHPSGASLHWGPHLLLLLPSLSQDTGGPQFMVVLPRNFPFYDTGSVETILWILIFSQANDMYVILSWVPSLQFQVWHLTTRRSNNYSTVHCVAEPDSSVGQPREMHFQLLILSTYEGFIKLQPHCKWRSIYVKDGVCRNSHQHIPPLTVKHLAKECTH